MDLVIESWVHINNEAVIKDGVSLLPSEADNSAITAEEMYRHFGYNYMKFFKMDLLCKWAWLGAELLLKNEKEEQLYKDVDITKVAVVTMTDHGCIDVDKKYKETMKTIPSPALFVYTLPNIMLGEICIRHGLKGEQCNLVSEAYDIEEQYFWVNDLLQKRGMDACLLGWVDAYNNDKDICLFWVKKGEEGIAFSVDSMKEIYNKQL